MYIISQYKYCDNMFLLCSNKIKLALCEEWRFMIYAVVKSSLKTPWLNP